MNLVEEISTDDVTDYTSATSRAGAVSERTTIGREPAGTGRQQIAGRPVSSTDQPDTRGTVTGFRRHVRRPRHTGGSPPDRKAAERAVTDLLVALGRDPADQHLADTPRRVADALLELTTPTEFDLTTFPNDEGYEDMVVAVGIPIHSLCEHHLLPFTGVAHIGYLPDARILGLSKLARVAEMFARDLQVQERLTAQIADWLTDNLDPLGVGVVIEAEHLCQSLRGVRATGTRTVTSALRGTMRDEHRCREEFLALTRNRV